MVPDSAATASAMYSGVKTTFFTMGYNSRYSFYTTDKRPKTYLAYLVLNSASEMKILQYVTDLWTMNITFYKEKLNPLSSLMTGATYWCKKQTAIVLVSDRQRNAASQKLI